MRAAQLPVAQLPADVGRAGAQQPVQLGAVADVAAERLLARDALGPVGDGHLAAVDAAGALAEADRRVLAEPAPQRRPAGSAASSPRVVSPRLAERRLRRPGRAREGGAAAAAPGTRPRRRVAPPPSRAASRRSEATLATILRGGHAARRVELALRRDAVAQVDAPSARAGPCADRAGDVEVRLVERERLHLRGELRAPARRPRARRARYAVKSTGSTTACGQSRSARPSGIAECTPKRRASYDAALTTPRR